MFFSLENELITRDGEKFNFVYGEEKEAIVRAWNAQVTIESNRNGQYLRHKNFDINFCEEVMNRGPMFINLLKLMGYKNILFVGHFNNSQPSWILDKFAGRVIDVQPPERSQIQWAIDHNVMFQFLPMVHKALGYKGDFKVVSPEPVRHRGVMHAMYKMNGIDAADMCKSATQYRHGLTSDKWSMEAPAEKFDAVVFLGVPKNQGAFDTAQVKECFASYCTPDFDVVDLYYGQPDDTKWRGGEKKDHQVALEQVWSNRVAWDPSVISGRPEEIEIMSRMVSVF